MDNFTRGTGFFEGFLSKKRAKIALGLIPVNSKREMILDIGCGKIPYFLMNSRFKKKYGIDPSLKKNNSYEEITLISSQFDKKLPFKNDFFDVVTMLAVFEHIEPKKLNGILKEIKRVLKKNGVFIMTTPSLFGDRVLRIMKIFNLVSPEELDEHKGVYGRSILIKYLERAGFRKESIEFGYFEFLYVNSWVKAKKD